MDEYIRKKDALRAVSDVLFETNPAGKEQIAVLECSYRIRGLPAAEVIPYADFETYARATVDGFADIDLKKIVAVLLLQAAAHVSMLPKQTNIEENENDKLS